MTRFTYETNMEKKFTEKSSSGKFFRHKFLQYLLPPKEIPRK
jgi:hypothetical protein